MKISELIDLLQQAQEEHGDIEVVCFPYDGQSMEYSPVLRRFVDVNEKLFIDGE